MGSNPKVAAHAPANSYYGLIRPELLRFRSLGGLITPLVTSSDISREDGPVLRYETVLTSAKVDTF